MAPVSHEGVTALPKMNTTESQGLLQAYGKMPLSFEVNEGQTNPQVKFLSRGAGYELFLTSTEAVVVMGKPDSKSHEAKGQSKLPQPSDFSVLRVKLLGSNALAKISGTDELPGKTNYFIGKDPSKWRTNVRQFSKVRYHDVYPGATVNPPVGPYQLVYGPG